MAEERTTANWARARMAEGADSLLPPNPDYGKGIFRRRILMRDENGRIDGVLEDTHHGLRCAVAHDGTRVTAIGGDFMRPPTTNCGGAVAVLDEFVGLTWSEIRARAAERFSSHCTHFLDLVLLQCSMMEDGAHARRYDVVIPDETDLPADATVAVDRRVVHRWPIKDGAIASGPHAGRALFGGFTRWANATFSGRDVEAALMLQKGYLVAIARRYRLDDPAGPRSLVGINSPGVCYAYAPERIATGRRTIDNVRDLTAGF